MVGVPRTIVANEHVVQHIALATIREGAHQVVEAHVARRDTVATSADLSRQPSQHRLPSIFWYEPEHQRHRVGCLTVAVILFFFCVEVLIVEGRLNRLRFFLELACLISLAQQGSRVF